MHFAVGRKEIDRELLCELFSDAEGGEDASEDVVGGGGTGEGIEGSEGIVEIEQKKLMGKGLQRGLPGFGECAAGFGEGLGLAEAGNDRRISGGLGGDGVEDGSLEGFEAFAGEG
jgi:hypothetical protein